MAPLCCSSACNPATLSILFALAATVNAAEESCRSSTQPNTSNTMGLPSRGFALLQRKQELNRSTALDMAGATVAPGCDVVAMGEIRSHADPQKCMDVDGSDGRGDVNSEDCNGGPGHDEEVWALCADGTLRNKKSQWCLARVHLGGGPRRRRRRNLKNVKTQACDVFGGNVQQQWDLQPRGTFTDNGGIVQTLFAFANRADSSQCIQQGSAYHAQPCSFSSSSRFQFFFRERGQKLATGKLVNGRSGLCMGISGSDVTRRRRRRGAVNIQAETCTDAADQLWIQYVNGEMVNSASGECLEVAGSDGTGNIQTWPCHHGMDSIWRPHSFGGSQDFSLVNGQSGDCIDTKTTTGTGHLETSKCAATSAQTWLWRPTGWLTPVGSWGLIGCHENGPLTYSYAQGVESSRELSQETTVTIGFEISAGTEFNSVTVSSEISHSLGEAWTSTQSVERTVEVTCQTWPDGSEVTGRNCVWQWNMRVEYPDVNAVDWHTVFTKCTNSPTAPKCPPFHVCADAACSACLSVTR